MRFNGKLTNALQKFPTGVKIKTENKKAIALKFLCIRRFGVKSSEQQIDVNRHFDKTGHPSKLAFF